MKQFREIKASYPGTLLLFRVGDFYELFGEDAVMVAIACMQRLSLKKWMQRLVQK